MREIKVNQDIANILKSYVYIYIDPRNNRPFYIGKGNDNRLFAHLDDNSESENVRKINEIRECGLEPVIDILRYGLSDAEASLVESAAIDLIGKLHLTNKVSGYHSTSSGRINSREIITMLNAKEVEVVHKSLLITINKLFRSDMSSEELLEATRGVWKLGPKREGAQYALSVYQGIVREVYKIKKWYPAGTLSYETRNKKDINIDGRWEFDGDLASQDVRDYYIGSFVGLSGQNPIRYRCL